jgi:hypothetical protein
MMMKKRQLKQIKQVLKLGVSLILMMSLSLGGWWWLWPWQVKEVRADTQPKTFTFETTAESFLGTAGSGDSTLSYNSGIGNPFGALESRIYGRKSGPDANYWEWTGTWEDLGVPSGGTVTQIRVNAGYTRCTEYNVGIGFTVGPYELRENGGTLIATLWSGRSGTATDGSWVSIGAQSDQSVTGGNQASNTTIRLRLNNNLEAGNNGSAAVTTYDDEVAFVITYTAATSFLTQNDFELFVDNDVLTPTDAWPSGARNLDEGTALTALPVANDPIDPNDEIRIRMNIAVTTAELAASAEGFILQFAKADDCTAGPSWTDVGSGDWGFATSSVLNNTTLTSTVIDTSSVLGRYNNADPSDTNPNAVPSGQAVEWDWHVVYNGSAGANTYCFRMRRDDPADLDAYENDGYPKISTRPAVGDQMRHGEFFSSDAEQGFFWTE